MKRVTDSVPQFHLNGKPKRIVKKKTTKRKRVEESEPSEHVTKRARVDVTTQTFLPPVRIVRHESSVITTETHVHLSVNQNSPASDVFQQFIGTLLEDTDQLVMQFLSDHMKHLRIKPTNVKSTCSSTCSSTHVIEEEIQFNTEEEIQFNTEEEIQCNTQEEIHYNTEEDTSNDSSEEDVDDNCKSDRPCS